MASTDNDLLRALALHYDDLVEHIRRRFSNQHFARDVVHDVCVQILEKPPLNAISVPMAFLRRATLNRAIDRRRAESTRMLYAQSQIAVVEQHCDPLDGAMALEFEQRLRALLAVIDALPARQRQVFLLHRIHGMPQKDIAQELEISVNMVAQHFMRAMRTLAQRWQPEA
ncbi:RNA polymerase sigma factor [Pseudomonas soli]|uniref:RNA polymerase sigma factor n=1 Tax=Pseudomonas soli TaxID=1306993 RepID=UPI00382B89C5